MSNSKIRKIFDWFASFASIIGCIISIIAIKTAITFVVKVEPIMTELQLEKEFHKDTVWIVHRDTVFISKDIPANNANLSFDEYVNIEKKKFDNYVNEQKKEFDNYKKQKQSEYEDYLEDNNEKLNEFSKKR